jgi:hypothetical protein
MVHDDVPVCLLLMVIVEQEMLPWLYDCYGFT